MWRDSNPLTAASPSEDGFRTLKSRVCQEKRKQYLIWTFLGRYVPTMRQSQDLVSSVGIESGVSYIEVH
ncbi:hypothetical protein Y1Q_0024679 [Alligator mississippiensis]|uniref:Uncharacterized protein n=1 Tax=Alligator mississippiensis TaxID=8496 RepID=A0A151PGT1_ALLMI|nr:hypothetical protein Y1Q_0024679 [Alligator mississippiensis]